MTASIVKLRKGPSGPVADPDEISDHKVKVSALDAAAGFLDSKLAAGAGITLTTVDLGGGFLAVQIAATGGGASGVPLAAAYFDGAGALASVAQYLADKPDAFQRPGVHDFRVGGTGRGAVYRLGSWSQDGDALNVTSEGFVTYGANVLGAGPSATDGALGFYEPNGFGVYNVVPGVNGGNTFLVCGFEDGSANAPFGYQGFYLQSNLNAPLFQAIRTGPDAGFVFVGQATRDNLSSARVQNASIAANGAQYRSSQYGVNVGVPGISTFKSRGATVGALVPCLPGDVIFRATAASVTQSGAIPLGGMISLQIPTDFPQTGQLWNAVEFELQLTPYAGTFPAPPNPNARRVAFKVNADGEVQTLRGVRAGGPATLPANLATGALWRSGAGDPEGVIVGSPGDLWSNQTGGTQSLYTKETGIATSAGWSPVTLPTYFDALAVSTVLLDTPPVVLHSLSPTPRAGHRFVINYSATAFQNVLIGIATATFELWIDGAFVTRSVCSMPGTVEFNSAALVFRTPPLTAVPHTIEIQAYSNEPSGQVSVPIPAGNSNLLVSEVAA
jgi:hypothetical protein